MPPNKRLWIAALVAIVAATYVLVSPLLYPAYVSDFDQLWVAARAWRHGCDPYTTVAALHARSGLAPLGLVYPFTAVVATLPLSGLPLPVARALVAATGAGALAYLTLGRAWWLFPVLLSGAFRSALSLVQVAPLTACAVLSPWFGVVAAIKPNTGAAAFAAQRSWRDAARVLVLPTLLVVVSFVLWPGWLPRWRAGVATSVYLAPLVWHPVGWLLPLALLRWRRPEARWLAVMSILPANPAPYDTLPLLLLLPQSLRQALIFALLTHAADLLPYFLPHAAGMLALSTSRKSWMICTVYLPALIVILRRPNARPEIVR